MSYEDTEKRIAFIIEHQAQFVSDIQHLREVQAETEQIVARLANVTLEGFKDVNAKIDALVDSQIRLNEAQAGYKDVYAKIDVLVDSQIRLNEGFKDVYSKIDTLVDSQIRLNEAQALQSENLSRTDESLRSLIAVVDRYFSEGRNGRGKG